MEESERAQMCIDRTDVYIKQIAGLAEHSAQRLHRVLVEITETAGNLNRITHFQTEDTENIKRITKKIKKEMERLELLKKTCLHDFCNQNRAGARNYTEIRAAEKCIKEKRAEIIENINKVFVEIIRSIEQTKTVAIEKSAERSTVEKECRDLEERTFRTLESIHKFRYVERPEIYIAREEATAKEKNKPFIFHILFLYFIKVSIPETLITHSIALAVLHINEMCKGTTHYTKLGVAVGLPSLLSNCVSIGREMAKRNSGYYQSSSYILSGILTLLEMLVQISTALLVYYLLCKAIDRSVRERSSYLIMFLYISVGTATLFKGFRSLKESRTRKCGVKQVAFVAAAFLHVYSGAAHILLSVHLFILICSPTEDRSLLFVSKVLERFKEYGLWLF